MAIKCLREFRSDPEVHQCAEDALHYLEHLTAEGFANGRDRVVREALALIADCTGSLHPESVREYLRV